MGVFLIFSFKVMSQDSLDQLLINNQPPAPPAVQPQQPFPTAVPTAPVNPQGTTSESESKKEKSSFFFFKPDPLKEKQRQERRALKERQKKELEDFRINAKEEIKIQNEKKQKIKEVEVENKLESKLELKKRETVVKEAMKTKRVIDVITSDSDPLLILHAEVKNTKTPFLKLKDVDFNYQVILKNQTPKIINFVLLVWDRKIPFTGGETLLKNTVTISKPIVPYEERLVEFNEPDSKREGETFAVRITKIVFEDKTEWKNPLVNNDG